MDAQTRIQLASAKAQEAFWDVIAKEFPEAKSGDFSPADSVAFDSACVQAATAWVEGNVAALSADGTGGQPGEISRPRARS